MAATRTIIGLDERKASSSANSSIQYSSGGVASQQMAGGAGHISVYAGGTPHSHWIAGTGHGASQNISGTVVQNSAVPAQVSNFTLTTTGTGGHVVTAGTGGVSGIIGPFINTVTTAAGTGTGTTTIKLDAAYEPLFPVFAAWLPAVTSRIENATIVEGYADLQPSEWVSIEVSSAAIRFFQNAADVLPGEPFIYKSKSGALIAEFSASNGALTTVITPSVTTVFAVRKDDPEEPIQMSLKRGSNRVREDLKEIVQVLTASPDGQVGTVDQR